MESEVLEAGEEEFSFPKNVEVEVNKAMDLSHNGRGCLGSGLEFIV